MSMVATFDNSVNTCICSIAFTSLAAIPSETSYDTELLEKTFSNSYDAFGIVTVP